MNRCPIILAIVFWCSVSSVAPVLAQEKKPAAVKMVRSLTALKGEIDNVRFSPCGREILASGHFGTILLDIESGEIVKRHKTGGIAIFTPDGKHIFIGNRYTSVGTKPLIQLDRRTWESTELMPDPGTIHCMVASEDGRYLLCGGTKEARSPSAGSVSLWSVKDRKQVQTLEGHLLVVKTIVFVPGSFQALSYSADCTARRWDLANGKELMRIGKPVSEADDHFKLNFAVFRDGATYTTGHYVFEVASLTIKHKVEFPQRSAGDTFCVAISPDQKIIAVGYRDGIVRLYISKTGNLIHSFPTDTKGARVNSIDFSPDGRFLATAGYGWSADRNNNAAFHVKIWKLPPVE